MRFRKECARDGVSEDVVPDSAGVRCGEDVFSLEPCSKGRRGMGRTICGLVDIFSRACFKLDLCGVRD